MVITEIPTSEEIQYRQKRVVPGRRFSKSQVEKRAKEIGEVCEGCGRPLSKKHAQGHHVIPRHPQREGLTPGTNADENLRCLCGPRGCHNIFDDLVQKYGITFPEVEEVYGQFPLKNHSERFHVRSVRRHVERSIVRNLRKAS